MTYDACLAYLYAQLPMYQRSGASAYKADLSNTTALMQLLGNPEQTLRCIHVAGTNGKGSVSHMLASVFQEAGYKTGLYTSPHLKDFRERIRINGDMIPEVDVVAFVEKYREHFEPIQLSFFEWTVGLAFDYFRAQQTDIAIVEVGMGGRLDSTNVITPVLSVITNIGLDHTAFLGETLAKIATEKAGIIKPGIPIIIGERQTETTPIFYAQAMRLQSQLHFAEDIAISYPQPEIPLKGNYQRKNIQTVQAAFEILKERGFNLSTDTVLKGLQKTVQNTGLIGRWQILSEHPVIICDTAHNAAGLRYVMDQLQQTHHRKLHIVWGMVSDKERSKIWPLLPVDAHYYFCCPDILRGLSAQMLWEEASLYQLYGEVYVSVNAALEAARIAAHPDDVIFVGGSTFVVAEVI
jgi:dihydrofolate synthase/folylpolyglutamate synthase